MVEFRRSPPIVWTASPAVTCLLQNTLQKLRHALELVDVIRRRVPRETEQLETAGVNFAELLHAARTPAQHRGAPQAESVQQKIGGFRRAREGAGKDLGMGDEKSLLPSYRCAGELNERVEIVRVEGAALLEHHAFRHVRR